MFQNIEEIDAHLTSPKSADFVQWNPVSGPFPPSDRVFWPIFRAVIAIIIHLGHSVLLFRSIGNDLIISGMPI